MGDNATPGEIGVIGTPWAQCISGWGDCILLDIKPNYKSLQYPSIHDSKLYLLHESCKSVMKRLATCMKKIRRVHGENCSGVATLRRLRGTLSLKKGNISLKLSNTLFWQYLPPHVRDKLEQEYRASSQTCPGHQTHLLKMSPQEICSSVTISPWSVVWKKKKRIKNIIAHLWVSAFMQDGFGADSWKFDCQVESSIRFETPRFSLRGSCRLGIPRLPSIYFLCIYLQRIIQDREIHYMRFYSDRIWM